MAYSDQIALLQDSLKSYSAEEEKLKKLYQTAITNAEKQHSAAKAEREKQYYLQRNAAAADNAREERNAYTALNARGLGFSGEAAQTKLNSNINLSNRLGELRRDKYNADIEADLKLADTKANIEAEQYNKLTQAADKRNQLNLNMAELELDRETADADREAEIKMHNAELKAKQDMLKAELNAKYSSSSGGSSSGSGSGGNKAEKEEALPQIPSENGAFIPNMSAEQLAQKILSTTGSKKITDSEHIYTVNKFLLELINSYNIDKDYYSDLMFMLKAYGYEETSEPMMRIQVAEYEARGYYYEAYYDRYDTFVMNGVSEADAMIYAKQYARNKELEYVYERVNNNLEFRLCCRRLDYTEDEITQFINSKKAS